MREVSSCDLISIFGGAGEPEKSPASVAQNACKGMPDSTKVSVTVTATGQVGIGSTSSGTAITATLETTCGAVRSSTAATTKPPGRSSSGVVSYSAGGGLFLAEGLGGGLIGFATY
jgi:hypothetical protein